MTNALGFFKRVHFVGIGGIGMSGIAEVLHNMNFSVSGSDISENANVKRLQAMGITVNIGHSADNLAGAEVLVYSSAVQPDNPELVKAKENFLPVIPRGEMLAELMRMQFAVAVSGSHGKTTTTSMISELLSAGGYDPTTIIGGRLNRTNDNAHLGKHNIMVAEADESDRSFLMLYPSIAVVTNIDHEHMESYADFADVKDCFVQFANSVPFYGRAILCLDNPQVADIIPRIEKRFITYGVKAQADVRGYNIQKDGFSVSFDVEVQGMEMGRVTVNLPGDHIILNSLAAIAVGLEMQMQFEDIAAVLSKFEGVQRRMSVRYKDDSTMVIDDYGHHPTEIMATLKAIREALPNYRICAVFQPHRYTRTENLMSDFAKAFFDADSLYVTDIYAASEQPIEGIDAPRLVNEVRAHGFKDVQHLPVWDDIYTQLEEQGYENTVVVTLGAGSITRLSHEIGEYIKKKQQSKIKSVA
ncbi:MAG: UDP-N-acetylmuramate--L-alanine ligase [Deferribacteraceae bacterium]|jgi:UDP-N-acetylmuramate--alanine ligase|nr:UDP-N-acetylmuramate--L-alanine ligase [Deferribacteraceae bacterium]